MKKLIFVSIILTVLFCSCGKDPVAQDNPLVPIELTKAESEITADINAFGIDLFKILSKDDQMMISPLSISQALAMTAYGAEGETYDQIVKTLGFEDFSAEEIGAYYKKMVGELVKADVNSSLFFANSIWANSDIPIKPSYKEGVADYFSSEVTNADLTSPSTLNSINDWVSEKTGGKIGHYLESLDIFDKMLLINALYFKSSWKSGAFDLCEDPIDFIDIDGECNKVKMMRKNKLMPYSSFEGFERVSVAYGNGAFAMDIILPPADIKFKDAVATFDSSVYNKLLDANISEIYELILTMPLFSFDTTQKLNDALKEMGMSVPFTGLADFSKMSDSDLYISSVYHKTSINVDQAGTVAAAASSVNVGTTMNDYRPTEITVDRPFVFTIRETSTNTILFIGQKVR